MPPSRSHWPAIAALGLVTITAYGSWFYGYGVLIDEIRTDTGWPTTTLGVAYSIAQVTTGLGAFVGGRLLDRFGGVGPFGLQLVVGGGLLFAASWATHPAAFVAMYAVGGGVTGATGFYHVTTVAASRLQPHRPEKSIATLTIIGAFSSPIYLPVTAWLLTDMHWRTVARILALSAIVGAAAAATLARGGASPSDSGPSPQPLRALRLALSHAETRRMLGAFVGAGMAFSSVIVYQVPILTAAGMTLGTAGGIAGFRGFCQIFGRVGLIAAVDRHGSGKLLRLAYAAGAVGFALLLVGNVPAALAYGFIAGTALGATSPLQPMYARRHFSAGDLGLLMGLQGAAMGLAGAVGPTLGGVLQDATDSWTPTIVIGVVSLLVSTALIVPDRAPRGTDFTTSAGA